jgi:hypothetical protein
MMASSVHVLRRPFRYPDSLYGHSRTVWSRRDEDSRPRDLLLYNPPSVARPRDGRCLPQAMSSMFLVTTDMVSLSSAVGLNSTSSVPA